MASLLILEQHEDATAGLSLIKLFASVESLSGVLAASYHTYFKNKTVGNSTTKQFCTESNISIGTFMDILNDLRENQYTMMGTNAYMNGTKVVKTFYLEKYRGSNAYSSSIVSDAQKRSSLANAYRKSISDNYIRSATNEAPAVSNDVAQTKSPPPPPPASKVSSIFGGSSQNESNNSTADAAPSRSRSIISSRMASLAQMRSSRAEKSPSTDTKTKKSSVATLFGIFSSAQDDTEYKDDVFVEDKAEVVVSSSAPTIKRPPSQKTFVPDTIAEENDEADTSQKYNNSYTPTINVVEAPKYSPPPPPVPPKPATPAATTSSNNYNDIVNSSSSAPKVSTPNYATTSATTPTSTPNVRGSVANAYLQATAKHTPVTTPVSAESEAMKQKNAEYFRAKREEEEEKKRQKAAEEEKMDPDQLARMKAEEAEKAGHDASKTAHYSRLGSAFVATRGTNLLAGGRGGAGRGPGVRKI
jgi:hypothetical protein